ncbi:MAG: hypothetical protein K9G58_11790 [Bacteroidales bacterium]|nr:hypothetical protein [Bacteroidales bacterium]MCF8398845.1 hypothetical protein [Bacteroidales bacterium]
MKKTGSAIDWIIICLTGIVLVWVSSNYKWGDERWYGILKSDGPGYYAYLPAAVIYQDLNFGFIDSLRKEKPGLHAFEYEFRRSHNGQNVNKYYAGTAVLQLPFYMAGHLLSIILDRPPNGYSAFYLIFVHMATLFYALLGLLFIRAFLKTWAIKHGLIAFVLIAIVFGTNLFHYIVSEPAMSHVYSFVAISAFVFFMRRYFMVYKIKYLFLSSALLGIIALIRPVNLLILFSIPFLSGGIGPLMKGFDLLVKKPALILGNLVVFLAIISIQMFIYKIQCGDFLVYTYKGEGFQFFDPDMINILFSYRKGLFIYTPLLFFSLAGFVRIFKESKFQFFTLIGFLLFTVYVLSSWEQWYYGGSFSGRVFIEYYVFFALLLALLLRSLKSWIKNAVILLICLLILLCQIQTYQYRTAQIHWSEMTKEKYWEVFPTPAYIMNKYKDYSD